MTRQEFMNRLLSHDVYYARSDDNRAYQAGLMSHGINVEESKATSQEDRHNMVDDLKPMADKVPDYQLQYALQLLLTVYDWRKRLLEDQAQDYLMFDSTSTAGTPWRSRRLDHTMAREDLCGQIENGQLTVVAWSSTFQCLMLCRPSDAEAARLDFVS